MTVVGNQEQKKVENILIQALMRTGRDSAGNQLATISNALFFLRRYPVVYMNRPDFRFYQFGLCQNVDKIQDRELVVVVFHSISS